MSDNTDRIWKATAVITSLCAVIMTGLFAWQAISGGRGPKVVELPPEPVSNWEAVRGAGHRIGTASPKVTIVSFGDFECSACRSFVASSLRGVRAKYSEELQVIFRHYPLDYHRFAIPAARAAECAAAQDAFEPMHDLLYLQQDSLGFKPFTAFAQDAGVGDTARFSKCIKADSAFYAIERDRRLALDIRASGTPTLVIEGLRYRSLPDSAQLDAIVRDLLGK
jgi:protein-disulfide isomerase